MQEIQMYGTIGYDDLQGTEFVKALTGLAAIDKEITICIDSVGGSVFDALSIYNCIKSLQADGVKFTADIEVLCASAASFIAIACDKVVMNSYALFMIHSAKMYVSNPADMALLTKVNDIALKMYMSKTGKSENEMKAMLSTDTWMTADEAVANKFVDEVVSEGEEAGEEIMAKVDMLRSINNHKNSFEVIAQLYVPKNNSTVNMLEKVTAALNLDAKANQDTIVASISGLNEQIKKATAEAERLQLVISEQKTKIESYEGQIKAEAEKRAEELVAEAVKIGKVSAATKDQWLKFANADFEGTKAIINDLPKATVKLHTMITSAVEPTEAKVQLSPLEQMKLEMREKATKKSLNE
ncbi:MAG: ATP-dependent Clp protease proteolytic subunit [Bacteroidetes bacterium]|nr:ATP-dependent Clp protease proteolytic subunit [Bacteroidota bacterium]